MTAGFPEITFGGVLIAPFVGQAATAFAIFLACRPLLRRARIVRFFADPPLVAVGLFVIILAAVTLAYH